MVKIKEMPYEEKYRMVIDQMKFSDTFVMPLVQKHLGDQAVAELKKARQEGVQPIPEGASFEEKYDIAFSNFVWTTKSTYNFLRKKMGEEGIKTLERATVEAMKQKTAGPTMFLFGFMKAFSPGLAFTTMTRQMAYQLQWSSPFSVPEMTKDRAVFDIPHCKTLDFQGTEDICLRGCQGAYPTFLAEQFKVKMEWEQQGKSCKCILTRM